MRSILAMSILIVANFMDLMDTTVVNVALPSIQGDLGMSPAQLEWIVGAYTLGLAATLVTGGRLGDICGRRSIFVVGVAGFTLASLLAAVAWSPDVLVLARATQGVFAGLMVPQVLASVHELFAPEKRAPVFGLVGFITGSASVVGPVLAGWLISSNALGLGWRSIFMINVPIGAALIIGAYLWVPNHRSPHPLRLDIVGVILATAAVLGVAIPLVDGRQAGWPLWCWLSLAAAAGLTALFLVRQRSLEKRETSGSPAPLIPPRLFRNRGFVAGSITNFTFQAALVGLFLYFALYLQQALAFTPLEAGLTWLGFSVGAVVGSVVASTPLGVRFARTFMFVGGVLAAAGAAWVAVLATDPAFGASPTGWTLTPALTVGGIGMGMLIVPLFGATLATIAPDDAGSASGTLSMLQQIGGVLGVAAIGVVFFADSAASNPSTITSGFHDAAMVAALLFLTSSIATLFIDDPKTPRLQRAADHTRENGPDVQEARPHQRRVDARP